MATNLKRDGLTVECTVPSGTVSGGPVVVNGIPGVVLVDRTTAGKATVDFTPGKHWGLSVNAVDDDGDSAVAEGDELFFTAGDTIKLSKKKSGSFWGRAMAANPGGSTTLIAAGSSGTINVRKAGDAGQGSVEAAHVADVTALTDSTGLDETHDDTVAPITAAEEITDNSGGVDPGDHTIAAITEAAEITDSGGGVDPADDIIAEITGTANGGSADTAPVAAAIAQLAAKANVTRDAVTAAKAALAQLAAKQNTTSTAVGVVAQDLSDLAQKLNEVIANQAKILKSLEYASIHASA